MRSSDDKIQASRLLDDLTCKRTEPHPRHDRCSAWQHLELDACAVEEADFDQGTKKIILVFSGVRYHWHAMSIKKGD